jgi:hypothetical protein
MSELKSYLRYSIIGLLLLLIGAQTTSARTLLQRISFHPRADGRGYVVWFDVSEPLQRNAYSVQQQGMTLTMTMSNIDVLSEVGQTQPAGPVYSYTVEPSQSRVVFRFVLDQAIRASAYPDRSGDMILNLEYTNSPVQTASTTKSIASPQRTTTAQTSRTAAVQRVSSNTAQNTATTSRVKITSPLVIGEQASTPAPQVSAQTPQTNNQAVVTPSRAVTTPTRQTSTTQRIATNASNGISAIAARIESRINKPNTPTPLPSTVTIHEPPKVAVVASNGQIVTTPADNTLPSSQMATPTQNVVIPEPERRADGQVIIQPFGTAPSQPIIQPNIPSETSAPLITPPVTQPDETHPLIEEQESVATPQAPITTPTTPVIQPRVEVSKPAVKPVVKPTTKPTKPAVQPPVVQPPVTQPPVTQPPVVQPQTPTTTSNSLPRFVFMDEHTSPQKKLLEDEAFALARQWKIVRTEEQKQRLEIALGRKLSQIFETEQYLWRRELEQSKDEDIRNQEALISQRQDVKSVILAEWKAALLGTPQP